ncbi:dihydromonapterin reductase [Gayadomonas joobiniege]|uniref:dihydromonapterin reductase n=1 Tax=Gayadomonas joobiniege TaxID=1234606 RepID=UPI0003634703|nr:dihydromonapterin reductase [Gayadomonas joobiniege]
MYKNAILITGAAQRIGLAAARHFKKLGHLVIISYRTHRPMIQQLQADGIVCVKADFSTAQGIRAFCTWIQDNVSSLRALIHNASIWQSEHTYGFSDDLLTAMHQVHVAAPYQINYCCEALLKAGADESETGFSDIIHITDYTVNRGSDKHIAYCASKAALANLSLSFSKRFAPKIKVNSIAPSLILFNPQDSQLYKDRTLKKSLLGNEPGEIEMVNAMAYVLNSRYMTGRELNLDGGRHLMS